MMLKEEGKKAFFHFKPTKHDKKSLTGEHWGHETDKKNMEFLESQTATLRSSVTQSG